MDDKKETVTLNTYFPALDGIRCIAVVFVMFSHWVGYWQLAGFNIQLGFAGVIMFFTLSGFLISRILLVQKVTNRQKGLSLFRSFYIRRMLRIFPLYYAVLIIGLVWAIPGAREVAVRLATFTLNIPNAKLEFGASQLYGHFWSLSAEEQFYFIFPLLLILTPAKYLRHLFWGMLAAALLSRLFIYLTDFSLSHKKWAVYNITLCCLDSFGIGALLAWYYCYKPMLLKRILSNNFFIIISFLFSLILACWGVANIYDPVPNLFLPFGISVCCSILIGAVLLRILPPTIYSLLSQPVIVYIGKISFGVYVFHLFTPWIIDQLGLYYNNFHFSIIVYSLIYGVLTIVIASVSWKFFEKPINSLKVKFPYKECG